MNLVKVVDYIMSHDTGPAFRGKNYGGVTEAVLDNRIAVIVNGEKIVGVATAEVKEGNVLEVKDIYTSHPGALARLLENFYMRFPFHSIRALRSIKGLPGKQRSVTYSWSQILRMKERLNYGRSE